MSTDNTQEQEKTHKLIDALNNGETGAVAKILEFLNTGLGSNPIRVLLGEALGKKGDPRLRNPNDEDYWAKIDLLFGRVAVGKYMVTTQEWRLFVQSPNYHSNEYWSEKGIEWRDSDRPSWLDLAKSEAVASLIIPNQPVVGVSWFEAQAYANFHNARLLEFSERVDLVRGSEKRHYPWGSPFGRGNANTKEESISKPSAVGIFLSDQIPQGVFDLAGNVAEWTANIEDNRAVIHPGSWFRGAMASWPKASEILSAAARAMKHKDQTQGSDHYDSEPHRATFPLQPPTLCA